MEKYIYGVVVEEKSECNYYAVVPDIDGCNANGDTFFEAVENISNNLEKHLSAFKEKNIPAPIPTMVECTKSKIVYICIDASNIHLSVPTMSAVDAARELGVTKGRISQLISSGRLVGERLADGTNVTVESVEAYNASPRRPGRPKRQE